MCIITGSVGKMKKVFGDRPTSVPNPLKAQSLLQIDKEGQTWDRPQS